MGCHADRAQFLCISQLMTKGPPGGRAGDPHTGSQASTMTMSGRTNWCRSQPQFSKTICLTHLPTKEREPEPRSPGRPAATDFDYNDKVT